MANYATLKAAIAAAIKQNGNNEITGNLLQQQLLAMVNSLGVGYQYVGIATPDTNPGTPDQNVFYFAGPGTYPNFNNATIPARNVGLLSYNGTWHVSSIQTTPFSAESIVNDIIQLYDGTTPVYPRTRAEAVFFDNDTTKTLDQQFSRLGQEVYSIEALSTSYAYCRGKVSLALPGTIISNGKWYLVDGDDSSYILLKIHSGDTVTIKSQATRECIYAYLNSAVAPQNNVAADFIPGESRRSLSANHTVTITAVQDFFLYVTILYNGGTLIDYTPQSIEINGYRILPSASKFENDTYPKDYSIDSEETLSLLTTKKFFNVEKIVEGFPAPTVNLGYIGGNGRLANIESGYEHYVIKIMPGAVVKIKPRQDSVADYVVLKYYTSNYPASAFCDTIQGRQRVSAEYSFTVPSDAYYLVVTKMYSNSDAYGPASVKVNDIEALTGISGISQRVSLLEGIRPFIRFTAAQQKFEVFKKSSSGYVSYIITLENDAQIVQKLWRVTGGYVYGADKGQVATTLFSGENEWAAKFNGFGSFEGYTGGYHGGELLDGDGTCFVKFFADGKEVSDLSADFEIPCSEFSYIQYTTLNKVKDTEDTPIPGTPIFAHHLKSVTFKDGEMVCKNVIDFADDSTALAITYSGLVCIHKQTGASVIVPTGVSQNCVGDNSVIYATDKLDGEFIFYNAQKNVKAVVSSRFVRGIDVQNYLTGLAGYVWDRSLDSKYYRQITGAIQCSAANKLEFETKVKVDY